MIVIVTLHACLMIAITSDCPAKGKAKVVLSVAEPVVL